MIILVDVTLTDVIFDGRCYRVWHSSARSDGDTLSAKHHAGDLSWHLGEKRQMKIEFLTDIEEARDLGSLPRIGKYSLGTRSVKHEEFERLRTNAPTEAAPVPEDGVPANQ